MYIYIYIYVYIYIYIYIYISLLYVTCLTNDNSKYIRTFLQAAML